MIRLLLLLVLGIGCASGQSQLAKLPSGHSYKIKNFQFPDFASAREFLTTKERFFAALFDPSQIMIDDIPRWTKSCLAENQRGSVEEHGEGTFLVSRLYLNFELRPGFCSNSYGDLYQVVYVTCRATNLATEIIVLDRNFPSSFNWKSLCES